MMDPRLEQFADGLVFGEGMRWFGGRLWMGDMLGRAVYAFEASGKRTTVAHVPERPNGLGFMPNGDLLTTSMADKKLYRVGPDGALQEHSDLGALITGYCGDVAVHSSGRAYLDDVGYRVFEGEPAAPGRLLLVEPDGKARVLEDGLQFPNGIWISQDQNELIFAEGRRHTIWSYRIAQDGSLSGKEVFAQLDQTLDGLTIDAQGGVWVCQPYGHRTIRVVRGGEITHTIGFGDLKPVACALGGPQLKTLFVVAADYTLERMARDDTSATIYKVDVETPGFLLPHDPRG